MLLEIVPHCSEDTNRAKAKLRRSPRGGPPHSEKTKAWRDTAHRAGRSATLGSAGQRRSFPAGNASRQLRQRMPQRDVSYTEEFSATRGVAACAELCALQDAPRERRCAR